MVPTVSAQITKQAVVNTVKPSLSYLYRLQNLINQMTAQLGRLSEESHNSMALKKREYRVSSEKAATIHESTGNIAPCGTFLSLGLQATAAAVAFYAKQGHLSGQGFAAAQPLLNWAAEHAVPGGVNLYTHKKQADEQRQNSTASIRQIDVQNEGNKSGDSVSISTVLGELSRAIRDSLASASR